MINRLLPTVLIYQIIILIPVGLKKKELSIPPKSIRKPAIFGFSVGFITLLTINDITK